ncbi:type IV toxin-antitoxin system AbiEi family antitoxin domain-containing protein [Nocardioides mangrovi]|uniref:Type IV toxin-antitoxin system AbiEi family antitoxin domain-containing protein n=1 Tax=Nocardioides mangrovi TaxID=2874580 RepID=A0ABS7UE81_9ACTN|nr:type IV toxin-antitoxin system AbiEi family antitoxin domain-containing protein [Nocardioides mangrovi]MBZ5739306.1 type IV toxin-antitoxin system AbiEi family antitoxin domain-containing protein [Nocardioides mangrovi]
MVLELITPDGLLLRRDAVEGGYDDNYLARQVKSGFIVRIRQGAYALASVWDIADARKRQWLLSMAAMLQYDDQVALSHDSAAVVWDGPDHGLDLSAAHLTHFDGSGRRSAKLVHHEGGILLDDISRRRGHWITSPGRTVLDVASIRGLETGVVVGDDFVHRGLATVEEMRILAERMDCWPNTLALRLVLDLIDGRSESVGETLVRLLCRNMRLPRPELQWEVRDRRGRLLGRVDFAWPQHQLLGEFDGKAKYLRLRRPGETIEQTVLREKKREDDIREASGCRMIRFTWPDIFRPERTADRLLAMFDAAA